MTSYDPVNGAIPSVIAAANAEEASRDAQEVALAQEAPPYTQSLPTANESYRGQMMTLQGNGTTTADVVYICLMSSTGTYSWKQIVSG